MTDAEKVELLSAALLWLRNHLDVGKPEERQEAIARADALLAVYEPTMAGMSNFRNGVWR